MAVKVLHINYYDNWTGSGIAANRLHKALLQHSIDSRMLVMQKDSDDQTVILSPLYARALAFCTQRISAQILRLQKSSNISPHSLNLFPNFLMKEIHSIRPDLIHLHWFGGEMFSIGQIPQIPYPLVWTLHDCWGFCGTEHYMDPFHGDNRFESGYTRESRPAADHGLDLDRWIWQKKVSKWKDLNITFAAPSAWMGKMLEKSALWNGRCCHTVANCLDVEQFAPGDRSSVRKQLNIPEDKKVILFGAQSTSHPLKGMNLLREALKILPEKEKYLLISYGGNDKEEYWSDCGISRIHAGLIREPEKIIDLYQAADVFVCPSLVDNFPNTVLEAAACGMPVTAFRTGGLPEMILHRESGFLCPSGESSALAEGIVYCLENRERLSGAARDLVLKRCSPAVAAQQYIKIYEDALAGKKNGAEKG